MEKYIIEEFALYFTFTKNLPVKRLLIFLDKHKDILDYCKSKLLEIPEYNKIEYVLYSIIKNRPICKCKQCLKYISYTPGRKCKHLMRFCSYKCMNKNKEFKNKRLDRSYESAGGINPFANTKIQKKIKETLISRYGVDNPLKDNIIRNKVKNTCLQRYGVENTYQSELIKDRIRATCIKRYGKHHKDIADAWSNISKLNNIIPLFTFEEFKDCYTIYNWKCKKCGQIFSSRYVGKDIYKKCYCQQMHSLSINEMYLLNFLKKYTKHKLSIISRDRKLIYPLELDIVIPEKKLAIEFNGNYWHNSNRHNKKYHLNKTLECEKNGYRLIHIWEYEWNNNKKQILKQLVDIINNVNNDKYIDNTLYLDRRWYNKKEIPGYLLIKETRPKLFHYGVYSAWDCGKLIYKKI